MFTKKELIQILGISITVIIIGLFVSWSVTFTKNQYSASSFTKRTGIEAECDLSNSCYVKQDGTWVPYGIWHSQQTKQNMKLEIKKD